MKKHAGLILMSLIAAFASGGSVLAQQGPDAATREKKSPHDLRPAAGPQLAVVDKNQPGISEPKLEGQARPAPPTGSAVINVGEILKALGLEQQLDDRHDKLQQKLVSKFYEQKAVFEAKKKQFGDHPTAEQKQELERVRAKCQAAVDRTQSRVNRLWDEYRTFAEDVLRRMATEPIRTIAHRRGLAVVLQVPNNAMAFTDDSADITIDVIAAIGIPRNPVKLPPLAENILDDDSNAPAPLPAGGPAGSEKKHEWTFPKIEDLLPGSGKSAAPK